MCAALDVVDLVDDRRYSSNRARIQHSTELDGVFQRVIGELDLEEVVRRFAEHDAPIAPVLDAADVYSDPHIRARGSIVELADAELDGPVTMQQVVGRMSRTPGRIRSTGAPIGAHNREVLVQQLGFDERELRTAGIPL
jgi:crotonobetainyl-CoA:carnitine CoA-transferase CaiB-like acyl-CoA transferase